MDPNTRALMMGAAGSGGAEKIYIEDTFFTFLYTGNGSTQTITNGIDLSGKGGLVWIKYRSGSLSGIQHALYDTTRGANKTLQSNGTQAELTTTDTLTAFNSSGFTLGADITYGTVNYNSSQQYSSWTFRKAAKFFDVVTYVGNGTSTRNITHSLGAVPGAVIVKRTDTTSDWKAMVNGVSLHLNSTSAADSTTLTNGYIDQAGCTSTVFQVAAFSGVSAVNASGATYVAYLFAHDAGGFGDSGSESVVKCGSFSHTYNTNTTVDLGWEPQWVLIKSSTNADSWRIMDNMRGMPVGSADAVLYANLSNAEDSASRIDPTATGFIAPGVGYDTGTYIYIAIRRGPMKTPTDATKVFNALTRTGTGAAATVSTTVLVDLLWSKYRGSGLATIFYDRLRGTGRSLISSATAVEGSQSDSVIGFDSNSEIRLGIDNTLGNVNYSNYPYVNYLFRRASGFFDVVAYTGTGSARTVSHNLGAVPELMIVKGRAGGDATNSWGVYAAAIGATKNLELNSTSAQQNFGSALWNSTTPTSSVFSVNTSPWTNGSGTTYIAYLFASCPGVSKVGSYTGTGTTLSVDCGFTNGARFVLIKRTDSTGDWLVGDTVRGIVAAADPLLRLNTSGAEDTTLDWLDPTSGGFIVNQETTINANVNNASYIYLAIA